jgi:hypothetical protein
MELIPTSYQLVNVQKFCRSSSDFCVHIVEEGKRLGTMNMYMATVLRLGLFILLILNDEFRYVGECNFSMESVKLNRG